LRDAELSRVLAPRLISVALFATLLLHSTMAATMEAAAFPDVLTLGGDCRLTLNAKGVNKYHCMPNPIPEALFRGSCTCNIPTEEAFRAAEATYGALKREEVPPKPSQSVPNVVHKPLSVVNAVCIAF